MASASFTEIVSYFAGYLRIFHDIARDRIDHDDRLAHGVPADYTTLRPNFDHRFMPDDMNAEGGPPPEPIMVDPMDLVRGRPLKLLPAGRHDPDDDLLPRSPTPGIPKPATGGGGGGGQDLEIRVKYDDGGAEIQLTAHQRNFMHDDDNNLSPDALVAATPMISALNGDAWSTVQTLVSDANGQLPENWQIPQDDVGIANFVAARDTTWAEGDGAPDAHSVPVGYYVNGELQERPEDRDEQQAPAEQEAANDTGIGQWAELGGNHTFNAGLIFDAGEGARTMVVMKDYFKTDAIFQTNTIVDKDEVSVSGGEGTPSIVNDEENVAANVAEFIENPSIYAGFPSYWAGPNWMVDRVDGDYYSIHAVAQTNYLSDNDVVVQVSSDSHYNLVGGNNELGNLALILNGEFEYDLIIIQGSYHGMNVIFQHNVLLNNDRIVMSADGTDPSQSISSGDNDLSNDGVIENYGGGNFAELTDGLRVIEGLLAAGATSIDPELGNAIAGNGGPLRVLYITGDYYDINAIWQTNVTSDVNVIYQLQNEPSADLLALHPDETVKQSVHTGGNDLSNEAAIVDVNPDVIYVDGDVYTDSILVQAELLPTDRDEAVNSSADALVTELIAFIDDTQDQTSLAPAFVPPPSQIDPMASVLH